MYNISVHIICYVYNALIGVVCIMERYNIYYKKYNVFARDYLLYVRVVYTDDIYHEVGKLYCTSFEKIDSIRYAKTRLSVDECHHYFITNGYKKISDNLYRLDEKPP